MEQQDSRTTVGAWTTAALVRYPAKKKLPRLASLLKVQRGATVRRQTLDEQRAILHALAASVGQKLERPKNG